MVTLDLAKHGMEFVDILFILVAVAMSRVFTFLLQQWSLPRHGDSQQQKEKTVILPPFWAARPVAWFAFAESKFREKAIMVAV